jgi:hypothetical protein
MSLFVLTAGSGWLAALLLGANVSVPNLIRSMQGGLAGPLPRLPLHYALGFLIPAVAFVHAWLPMSLGRMSTFGRTGLLLATAALLIMLGQIALGVSLRDAKGAKRRRARRLHLCTMVLILALIGMHVVLNRA